MYENISLTKKNSREFGQNWKGVSRNFSTHEGEDAAAVSGFRSGVQRTAQGDSKTPGISPELQQKLTTEMPAILGEIMGSATELTTRLGAEIGGEIGKEHPEYLRKAPAEPEKQ